MSEHLSLELLVINIVKAKKAYYRDGKITMSDSAYDKLEAKLKELDPRHPILYAVGYDDSYEWWVDHYNEIIDQHYEAKEEPYVD